VPPPTDFVNVDVDLFAEGWRGNAVDGARRLRHAGLAARHGSLLNYQGLRASGATAASLVTCPILFVGVAAAVLVLGEPFSDRLLPGAVVVGFGIVLIQGRILGSRSREPDVGASPRRKPPRDWPAHRARLVPSIPLAMGV
jgi:hypothetical protein